MNAKHESMYGCDPDAMLAQLAEPLADRGLARVLNSLLSDAQELLGLGKADAARKLMNCVKFVIDKQLPNVRATPADVAVQDEVAHLRALQTETTPGTWHALDGRSLVICGTVMQGGYSGFDVLRSSGRNAREGKRNAEFSAKLHNAAGPLFDAAELVQHVLTEQEKLPLEERDPYITERAAATLAALKQSQQ